MFGQSSSFGLCKAIMYKSFAIDEKRNSARLFARSCVKGDLDDHLSGGSLEAGQLEGVDGQLEDLAGL